MTKNWDIFPKAQPVGEDLANFSCYRLYEKSAVAGYGVISGCVVSRNSSSRVDVSSGVYSVSGVSKNYAGGYISGITAAASGLHRYDLVYIDGADDTLKILSGDEDTPDSSIDFLENYVPRPAEPTDTDWVILAVVRVTDAGIENSDFGTNSYATGSVANMRLSPPFVVDDITLQVVNGIISIKSASSTKLDDLSTPDDNTDLNATSSAHGLLMKLSNSLTQFLNGQGSWTVPDHASLGSVGTNSHSTIDSHLSSTSNPHSVTAAQAGAAPTAKGVTNGDSHDHSGGDGAQIDHGGLGGLGDDDHTGYAKLAGRAGGQTIVGGTGSGDDLTLESTSHGTKGDVNVNGRMKVSDVTHAAGEVDQAYKVHDGYICHGTGTHPLSGLTFAHITYSDYGFRFGNYPLSTSLQGDGSNFTLHMILSSLGYLGLLGVSNPTVGLELANFATSGEGLAYAWGTHSSCRWKEHIEPIQDPISIVKQLQGVTFDWKKENGGKHDIGLIAEEVGKVIPEVVDYEENGIDAKSVKYDRLVAVLIEAVKAQQEQIEKLTSDIKLLEKITYGT
jgi:hypothetical protein